MAVNRATPKFSNHQWQDRTVTWRNKADVTTFYFYRFPTWVNEKDLWQTFQRWGKVWEVLIPKSRNKEDHRFGFVRFKEVEYEQGLERQLDNNIFFGGTKMFVNRPKFERGKVTRGNQNANTIPGKVSIQEVPRRNQGDLKTNSNGGRLRSYVEVVRAASPGVSSLCNQKDDFQEAIKDVQRPVVLNPTMEQKEWLQKAWVGRLKNRGMFERVEEELKWAVDSDVTPRYWADDWIILPSYLTWMILRRVGLYMKKRRTGSHPSWTFRSGPRIFDQHTGLRGSFCGVFRRLHGSRNIWRRWWRKSVRWWKWMKWWKSDGDSTWQEYLLGRR